MEKEIITLIKQSAKPSITTQAHYSLPNLTKTQIEDLLDFHLKVEVENKNNRQKYDGKTIRKYITAIAEWFTDTTKKNGLILAGNIGSGKTTFCYAIKSMVASIKNTHADILRSDRWKLSEDKVEEYTQWERVPFVSLYTANNITNNINNLERASAQSVLIIDDLGAECSVENVNYGHRTTPIIELLESRYEQRKPTIITTNMDLNQISQRYGQRIKDRICDWFEFLLFNNKSYRK